MKKYLPIVAIIALVVFAAGCVDSGTNNQTSNDTSVDTSVPNIPSTTYAKNNISFKYPESWTDKLTSSAPNAVTVVGDPDSQESDGNINTLAVIQKIDLPSGKTLKQIYDATYNNIANDSSFQEVSERTLNINGLTAYENIYKLDVSGVQKQERATWFEKDGTIYLITGGTLPSDFESQQTNFDLIMFSFKVTS
jgi:PBP1b-binding outer membrane lipoprotein LpoB